MDVFSTSNLGSIPVPVNWENQDWKQFHEMTQESMLLDPIFHPEMSQHCDPDFTLFHQEQARRNSEISMNSVLTYGSESTLDFGYPMGMLSIGSVPIQTGEVPLGVGKFVMEQLGPNIFEGLGLKVPELQNMMLK